MATEDIIKVNMAEMSQLGINLHDTGSTYISLLHNFWQ